MTFSDVAWLRPEMLWLALPALLLILLTARMLVGLAPWRRRAAVVLQGSAALLLVVSLAQPALVKPDPTLDLVVVLDASKSLSDPSRQKAIDYARTLLEARTPNDNLRFVATGERTVILAEEAVRDGSWIGASEVTTGTQPLASATDLAAGLRLASSLLDDTGWRRVALLTDGWQTRGDAEDEADRLRARGIDLQVVPLTALGDPEVVVEGLLVQPYARVGDPVTTELRVYSTADTDATLTVSVDGGQAVSRPATLRQGANSIPLEQRAEVVGFHSIQVELQAEADTEAENNRASATLVVKPQPRVVVLQERQGEADRLAQALGSQRISVEVHPPSWVPPQVRDLNEYDAIVISNVAATSLTLDQQRTIQEYVRRQGRGLVVVGGSTSYAKGGYADSVFEEVLPVSSQPPPRPEQGNVAITLIIDRSFSMDEYAGQNLDDPSKFAMAKEAARLAVDSLRVGDQLGVLTFDTDNMWAVPVRTISGDGDKEEAKRLITEIPLGGGTSIHPAVQEAARAIKRINAPSRHLVLLTDGQEFGAPAYENLLTDLRANGISLSTIGIGSDADTGLLTRLARLGQGRYYFTEKPSNIPKIVFKELEVALREATVEGAVQPQIFSPSPLLRGLSPQDLPQLGGYSITTPKPEAVIALDTDRIDPLLAHWNYGLGRVVAFTSDATPTWAGQWLTWDRFARFWDGAVRWTLASPVNPQLQPSISVVEGIGSRSPAAGDPGNTDNQQSTTGYFGVAHLSVESLKPDNSFADLADVTAGIRSASGVVTTTKLVQTAPGRYEAQVPLSEPGTYEVRLRRDMQDQFTITETAGFSVPVGQELLHAGTNSRLLRALSGGKEFVEGPEQALSRGGLTGGASESELLWMYPLAPALVLLLLSVAVRRVSLDFRRRRR